MHLRGLGANLSTRSSSRCGLVLASVSDKPLRYQLFEGGRFGGCGGVIIRRSFPFLLTACGLCRSVTAHLIVLWTTPVPL